MDNNPLSPPQGMPAAPEAQVYPPTQPAGPIPLAPQIITPQTPPSTIIQPTIEAAQAISQTPQSMAMPATAQAVVVPPMQPTAPAQNTAPLPQSTMPITSPQPNALPNPSVAQPYSQPLAPTQALTQAEMIQIEEGQKTLNILHKHERLVSVVATAITVVLVAFNILWGLHVISARNANLVALNKEKNALLLYDPKYIATQDAKTNGPESETRTDGTLDMSHKIHGGYAQVLHGQDIKIGLNQQANLLDGLSLMVTSIKTGVSLPATTYMTPSAGDQFVQLNMDIGYRGTQGTFAPEFYNMYYLNNGQEVKNIFQDTSFSNTNVFGTETDLSSLAEGSLNSGQTVDGAIVIQVPLGPLPTIYYVDQASNYNDQNVNLTVELSL